MQVTDEMRELKVSYELTDYQEEFLEAVEYADNKDDLQDRLHELADAKVDIYNGDLLKWVADDLNNSMYVDEAIEEYGWSDERGLFGALQMGQYKFHSDNFYALFNEYDEADLLGDEA